MAPTSEARVAYRTCPLCEACCGLELTVEADRVTRVRGNPDDVFSRGFICPKGAALVELHDDPDRLRAPLVKRDGRFVEASWDEAYAEIERRLPPVRERGGDDAVAVMLGNPAAHKYGLLLYGGRLAKALGTRNIYSASTVDQMPKQLSSGLMFGHWLSIPVPDIERTELLVILGANPMASNGSLWTVPDFRGKARALRERGGRIVVVDPRRTETAAVADQHLFIRPGADVFFLLGLVHTLVDEGLVRTGRAGEHVTGVDAVSAAVADFAPERVAARCGIDAAAIRALARELATTERAALYGRIGTCTQEYGTLASWLVNVINVLTGHLDEPGGAMFPRAPAFAANTLGPGGKGRGVITGRHRSRVSGAPEIYGELPLTCLAEEIETAGQGQVKALITIAGNPVLSAPGGPRLDAALATLDFMVSLDIYVNETTRHADVILPGVSPLEDAHYDVAFPQLAYRNFARYSGPVLPRADGQPEEWQSLVRLIGIARGLGAEADLDAIDDDLVAREVRKVAGPAADLVMKAVAGRRGPERLLDLALRAGPYGDQMGARPDGLTLDKVAAAPHGIDLGPLAPRLPELLRTPSGRIQLAPPMLLEDLPRVRADLDRAAPPLVIIGRRQLRSNNSWMHNLPGLARGKFRGTLLVHPDDASHLGLRDGADARLSRGDRAVVVQVELTDAMMPGVVSLPHGWGHDREGAALAVARERPGASLNDILDENARDPLSGNAVLGGVPIELAPID